MGLLRSTRSSGSPALPQASRERCLLRCIRPAGATFCASTPPTTCRGPRSRCSPATAAGAACTCSTTASPAMGRCWRRGSRRRPIDSVCGSRAARPGIPRTAPTRRWHGASPRRRAGRLRRRPARHERRPRGARPARKARERCRPARARRAHTTAAARALRRTLGTRSVREPRRRRLREAAASWRRVRTPLRRTQTGDTIEPAAVYAAQAAEVVQDSIARSDGTRGSVLDELFRTRVRGGLLGDFSFDRRGDITESPVTILQVANGGPSRRVASVVARVWRPRAELVNQRPLGGWGSRWDGLVHGGGGRRGSRPSSTRPRTSPSCQR
ncbi:MAG: hypothetical protein AVDCRST_MAG53-1926 [uncultured Solirubrobacteraceae bacterium]|uniref:Uncharacterized protein n=1 Tax=uncultured Solirubrobacteraceae bacterium TaxID=1162706 RepID=A0A6J4SIW2_9ACTN|nr:MAG: hypothetical protein AVDCRST_MAG53-1926 [uncultured Solirubrobacteraceae bacterium]